MTRRFAILLLLLVAGCTGSPGTMTNNVAALQQVAADDAAVYVRNSSGLFRVRIDGTREEQLAGPRYAVKAMSADGMVFVLSDSDTNLFVLHLGHDNVPRENKAFAKRLGGVAISPDGELYAASRHADYDQPQAQWSKTENDRVEVFDAVTDERVLDIPATGNTHPAMLWWSNDGERIYVNTFSAWEVIDVATGERSSLDQRPDDIFANLSRPTVCDATGEELVGRGSLGDEGLDILSKGGRATAPRDHRRPRARIPRPPADRGGFLLHAVVQERRL